MSKKKLNFEKKLRLWGILHFHISASYGKHIGTLRTLNQQTKLMGLQSPTGLSSNTSIVIYQDLKYTLSEPVSASTLPGWWDTDCTPKMPITEEQPPPLKSLRSLGESIIFFITLYYNFFLLLLYLSLCSSRKALIGHRKRLKKYRWETDESITPKWHGGVGKTFEKEQGRADKGSYFDDGNIEVGVGGWLEAF